MPEAPRVSVIMVSAGRSPYLTESLTSLAAQSFGAWELIFWDNGCLDDPRWAVQAVEGLAHRVRVLGGGAPMSVGAARARAAGEARGAYLAFLDDDDLWSAEKLERQVALAERTGAGLCYADCWIVDREGRRLGRYARRVRPHRGQVFERLLLENFIPTVTALLRRDVYERIGPFRDDLHVAAEYALWLRVARSGEVAYDAEPLASYRVRAGSLTSARDRAYREVDALYAALGAAAAATGDTGVARLTARARAHHHWRWALRGLAEAGGLGARLAAVPQACRRGARGFLLAGGPVSGATALATFASAVVRGFPERWRMVQARLGMTSASGWREMDTAR